MDSSQAMREAMQVWGPAQHGLYSNQMALITSDCDAISILDHQMALSTSDCDAMQGLINEVQDVTKELEACHFRGDGSYMFYRGQKMRACTVNLDTQRVRDVRRQMPNE